MNDKEIKLKEVENETKKDEGLPLRAFATNLVFGKGSPESEIMFVGEAPGKNEDLQGLPFVGAAGKNLDKLLARVKLSLKDIYITNILKYRPPENRDPARVEIELHTPILLKQIEIIRPKIVCSLGNYATKFFLALGETGKMKEIPGITQVHGISKDIEIKGIKIKLIPLFHPAAIIYNRSLIELWEKDMEIVKKGIQEMN